MGPQAINAYYELADVDDEYSACVEAADAEFLQTVIQRVCHEGTSWTISPQGAFTLPRVALKPEAKVWYHFLKFRLLPTTHCQMVSSERVILIYCILEGKAINVGRIIYGELSLCATQTKGNIWFPALITGLCEDSGVVTKASEEAVKVPIPIRMHTISALLKEKGVARQREGEEEEELPAQSGQPSGSAGQGSDAATTLLQQLAESQTTMAQQLKGLEKNNRKLWRYMHSRDQALKKNLKASGKKFFSFPQFPPELLQ